MATSNKNLNNKYLQKVKSLNKDRHFDDIYLDFLHGRCETLRYQKLESSYFDPSWIEVVEDVLFDLGEIVSNPKTVTKVESNIVPVELAKKTDGESVQHLASHTQYIKDIDDNGNVIPSKILSHSNEDNLITYENRFIATFIRRLVLFVEKRYEFISSRLPLHQEDVMYIKNTSVVNGEEVEIETKIRVKREKDDPIALKNQAYVDRIAKMREYIFFYYNSDFMHKLKNEKDVRKPILQTNIIRKNPLYRHCYQTFLFIEKFNSLGVNYNVHEEYKAFNEEGLANLNYLMVSNYLSLEDSREFESVKKSTRQYKPKILTSIDDELFTFGEPLTGTLEFVRVDPEFREYLNRRRHMKDLPLHPKKYEKLYYKDEYALKKLYEEDFKEFEKLLRRKVRENEQYEKIVQKILLLVAEEERKAAEERMRIIIDDEKARIEAKRKELIAKAYADWEKEDKKRQEMEAKRLKKLEEEERKRKEEEEVERLRKEAEEKARQEEEERLQREIEEENRLRREAEEKERLKEERLRKEAEEKARKEEEEQLKKEAVQSQENQDNSDETVDNNFDSNGPVENEKEVEEKSTEELSNTEKPVEIDESANKNNNEEEKPTKESQEEEVKPEDSSSIVEAQEVAEEIEPIDSSNDEKTDEPMEKVDNIDIIENKSDNTLEDKSSNNEENEPKEEVKDEISTEEQPVPKKRGRKKKSAPLTNDESTLEESSKETQPEENIPEEPKEETPLNEDKKEAPKRRVRKKKEVEAQSKESSSEDSNSKSKEVEGSNQGEAEHDSKEPKKNKTKKKQAPKKVEEAKKPEKKSTQKKEKKKETPIPGKFIVKTLEGYYVKDNKFSNEKEDAKVFDDFNKARDIKKKYGGKVVKL